MNSLVMLVIHIAWEVVIEDLENELRNVGGLCILLLNGFFDKSGK